MSDPAEEAARRLMTGPPPHVLYVDDLIDAAREVLRPLREMHKPVDTHAHDGRVGCDHCWDCRNDINEPWPCETAKLIYSTEELP